MFKKIDKNANRIARHKRVRKNVVGTPERPRLNVFRSTNHIYAQLIDDVNRVTLVSASTLDKEIKSQVAHTGNKEAAKKSRRTCCKKSDRKRTQSCCIRQRWIHLPRKSTRTSKRS